MNIDKKLPNLQTTISNTVSCYGIGVHSGDQAQVTFKPAPQNSGIIFVRSDITNVDNHIKATYDSVWDTSLSTSISNNANVKVSTIEHLMAALWGCGIDNLIVEIDGPEIPIMDGSSQPFVFMMHCAGQKWLQAKKKKIKILKEISVSHQGSQIIASPLDKSKESIIDLTIDFENQVIGKQTINFNVSEDFFIRELANSRTFGLTKDLEYLHSKGLAKGASLENAIAIENERILNLDGLRYKDEFVRHKALDFLGDLYCAGGNILANFTAYKPGHDLNNKLLRKIFENPSSYCLVN